MERIVDDFDSARRAKEIYSRKNGIISDSEKKKYFSIYKFLFQLLVLINLAVCLVIYKNRNFIFSSEFMECVNVFFSVNITDKINDFFQDDNSGINIENTSNSTEQKNISNNIVESNNSKNTVSKIDVIKESYSFEKPIEGTITSFFGNRESENKNISGFHTGTDISAIKGTKIKSAISGKVIQVSEKGDYGKHLKIKNNEITTLYAHCNNIFVKEGDEIQVGQEIAEVGNTGNSTGPHLHFEIIYNDEYINPCDIIKF